jgi:hypothetical protein
MNTKNQEDLDAFSYLQLIREASSQVPLVVTSSIPVHPADYFSRVTKLTQAHVEPIKSETDEIKRSTEIFDGKPNPTWESETILDFKRLQLALSAWTLRRERALKKGLDVIEIPGSTLHDSKPKLNNTLLDLLPAPLYSPPRMAGIKEWRSYCFAESSVSAISIDNVHVPLVQRSLTTTTTTTTETWFAPGDEEEDDDEEEEEEEEDMDEDRNIEVVDQGESDDEDLNDVGPSPTKKIKLTNDTPSSESQTYTHPNPPFLSSLLMYDNLMISRLLTRSINHAASVYKVASGLENDTSEVVEGDDDRLNSFDHETETSSVYLGKIPLRSQSVAMRCTLFAASSQGIQSHSSSIVKSNNDISSSGYLHGILTPSECLWIYALLAKLEQPLQGSLVASVRTLHVLLCEMRKSMANVLSQDENVHVHENIEGLDKQLAGLNTLLCVTGKVYFQAWGSE